MLSSLGVAGAAPNLAASFNPMVFPEQLRAQAWPAMMAHVPSPAANPLAAVGMPGALSADHAQNAQEADLTTTAMYNVVNLRGDYRPALIMPDEYIFGVEIPARNPSDTIALRNRAAHSYSSVIYGMTPAMLNHYMRAQHKKLFSTPRLVAQYTALRARAATNLHYVELLEASASLTPDERHTLRFGNPTAAASAFKCIGPIVSQPNALVSWTGDQAQSTTADQGRTAFSVATGGTPQLRNYWGRAGLLTMRPLWFVLMAAAPTVSYFEVVRGVAPPTETKTTKDGVMVPVPVDSKLKLTSSFGADLSKVDDLIKVDAVSPPQLVPWCANDSTERIQFKNSLASSEYTPHHVHLLEVALGEAVCYRIGTTLSTTKANWDTAQHVYTAFAGLRDLVLDSSGTELVLGPEPNISIAAARGMELPLISVMLTEKRNGTLLPYY